MIYERIEALCLEQNLPIRRLEADCGLSNGSISKWKKSEPAAGSLYKVASRLGVTVEALIEPEVDECINQ